MEDLKEINKTEQPIQMPRIGDQAPDFEAVTTTGNMKMSEFAPDKWTVMFSHPADFTPVCTTEMSGFAVRKKEFEALNTELLGLSIDSIHSHIGWVDSVPVAQLVFSFK
jgi:peroxiredoxin (alkyl hydroperoxide reductase subunit C)